MLVPGANTDGGFTIACVVRGVACCVVPRCTFRSRRPRRPRQDRGRRERRVHAGGAVLASGLPCRILVPPRRALAAGLLLASGLELTPGAVSADPRCGPRSRVSHSKSSRLAGLGRRGSGGGGGAWGRGTRRGRRRRVGRRACRPRGRCGGRTGSRCE